MKELDPARLASIRARTTPYDAADYLKTPKQIAAYLEASFEDGDPQIIAVALGNIARSKGMTALAKETGLSREALYTALSVEGNPRLTTFLKVISALGLHLKAVANVRRSA